MDRLILTGATLIDGTGAEPVRDRAVVIERGRIGAVLRGRPEGDATELALDGLTLLPGLINCHVHFCLGGEADPARVLFEDPVAIRTIKAVLRTKQTIEAGVTTVRDLGGGDGIALAMRDAVSAGLIPGPRVLAAARGICMTGGHGRRFGREAGIAIVATLIAPERIVTHGVSAGVPEFAVRKSEAVIARHLESFQLAMHHGVPIAAGTDAGTPFNPHGSIVPELALMVKAGMSPLEAIRAATSTAARGGRGPARRRGGSPREPVQARRPGGAARPRPRPCPPRRAGGAPRLRPAGALASRPLRPGAHRVGPRLRARVEVVLRRRREARRPTVQLGV